MSDEVRIQELAAAAEGDDQDARHVAAQKLAELREPAAEPALRRILKSPDGIVRARAAQGLDALGADGAIDALAATINELPNLLRYPFTLPVYGLIAHGEDGARVVARLLDDPDQATRERALLVVRMVADKVGPGGLLEAVADYDPGVDPASRRPAGPRVLAVLAR